MNDRWAEGKKRGGGDPAFSKSQLSLEASRARDTFASLCKHSGLERDPSGQSLGQAGRQCGGAPELNLK